MAAYDREPFREILALFLSVAPTCEALQAFANKHPDRWVQALVMLARLCGYTEELTTDAPIAVHIAQLSDAELMARLAELDRQRTAPQLADVNAL